MTDQTILDRFLAHPVKFVLHHMGNHQRDLTIHTSTNGSWIRCSYCHTNFSPHYKVWVSDQNIALFYDMKMQKE